MKPITLELLQVAGGLAQLTLLPLGDIAYHGSKSNENLRISEC